MRHFIAVAVAFCFFLIILGCQTNRSPIVPGSVQDQNAQTLTASTQTDGSSRYLWGYYHCATDLEKGTIEVLPNRAAELHINATKPLNKTLGIGFEIDPTSNPPAGYLVINVSIIHPFNESPGFSGFDVRGILLTSGSLDAGGLRMPGPGDPELINTDGWSRWWNPSEFTDPGLLGYTEGLFSIHGPSGPPNAMINAYKVFADGLWASGTVDFLTAIPLNEPNGRAIFRSGNTNTRQYIIQFPVNGGPVVRYDYAIDASWAPPTPDPPVQFPGDFPIWANSMEAFIVKPVVEECTLAGTPYGGAGSGEVVLSIEVWDWQGWFTGSYDGQIGNVKLYSPGCDFDPPAVEQTDGLHFTTLTVTATGIPSTTGTIPVLIEIPAPGTAWKQGAPAAPSGEMAAYARVSIDVGTMACEGDENETCDDAEPVDIESSTMGAVCMPFDAIDYYVFAIPTGPAMDGTITLDNFDYSDNDLILFDGCPGDIIDSSMNPYCGTEVITVELLESGFYYIAVLPGETAGTDVQPYNLILDIEKSATVCTEDNNNEYTDATVVDLQDNVIESVCAGADIRDWFIITVPQNKVAGGTIYIHNAGQGNVDIRVYDIYPGPATFWSSNTGTQDELLAIPGLGPGFHYIQLVALGTNPSGDRGFTMDIDLLSSDYECDSADGNNNSLTADMTGYTNIETGTVCFPADPDWYMFIVPQDKAVNGTITLSGNMVANNDIFFYGDPGEDPLDYSAEPGVDDEVITISNLGVGTYYIQIIAHPNVGIGDQPYTLTLDLEEKDVGNYDFLIHAHIICKDDGSSPATTETRVNNDVAWANEFYSQWGGSFELSEISYVNRTSWLAVTTTEMYQCHMLNRDKSGPINVYYANSFPDMPSAAAYCRMDCRPAYQTHNSTYIAQSDNALNRVLAHELGHATGIFHDVYLLELGYTSCAQISQAYCPPGTNLSFCKESDADYGNLMWFSIQGWNDPEDYWLSDENWQTPDKPIESQVENWRYFHIHYQNNF